MGFLDKIKGVFNRIKEDNKYLARTTARINNATEHYGWVNYKVGKLNPEDDFRGCSYINAQDGKGLIYNSGDEDYIFEKGDIVSFELIGDGHTNTRSGPNNTKIEHLTLRFAVEFKDGKKTNIDIICTKVDTFKAIFNL
jgi:hypothetical protein